jgi:glycosyltransferase involved in cell wall biosynthesis
MRPVLSLVLPIFNEEEVIPELHARLTEFREAVGLTTEVLFVDDGSKDRSLPMLQELAASDPTYRVLSFSRNFGHQAAISAGVDHADGEAVVVLDADLQDPPEVVLDMVAKWREGFDVVYGRRRSREGETWFKLVTAKYFYRAMAAMVPVKVPLDTGDFRLMSRRVVLVLRELKECHRFVRGLVAWVGFKQTEVLYDRPARFAGETKYPLRRMLRFAMDGITSFSVIPLRFATWMGLIIAFASFLLGAWAIYVKLATNSTVPGWATTFVLTAMLSSVQLVMIGILGEYVGRIYEQVKQRPIYILREADRATVAVAPTSSATATEDS